MLASLVSLSLWLSGCVGHHHAGDFDLVALQPALKSLSGFENGSIPKEQWPKEVIQLKAESVSKNEFGIYIKLDSAMVEESGLFYPTIKAEYGSGTDPSYVFLGNDIYSYHIKG